ncbi:MAG: VOC family protein [Pseudomonadota bacterium]
MMKYIAILLALAVTACASTPKSNQMDSMIGPIRKPTDFRRTTLIVADAERSLKLYRDILGFEPNYDKVLSMSGVALPAGEPGAKARLLLLEGNDPWVGWIGMLEWVDPPLDPRADVPTRLGIGDVVLLFNTTKVDERCANIKKLDGVRFTAEPRTVTYPGRNGGPDIKVRGCNFFDADGYLVELNQILE